VGLPERDGVLVRAVESDSPAERAGLRQGDLITTAGGREIADVDALAAVLDGLGEGETLPLHVVRGTEEIDVVARFDDAEDHPGDVGDA
jgi:serine protease Do